MPLSTSDAEPIAVHVMSGRGYVWNVDAVKLLRQQHRLVGAMVGGLTSFTNQLDVHGLPLRLSPEEVTLGLRKGWLAVYKCVSGLPQASTSHRQGQQQQQLQQQQQQQKRKRQEKQAADDYYSDYYANAGGQPAGQQDPYADYYADTGAQATAAEDPYADYYADAGAKESAAQDEYGDYYGTGERQAALQQDPYADYYSSGGGNAAAAGTDDGCIGQQQQQQQQEQQGQQAWHGAIKDGAWFEVPTTAQDARPINPGMMRGEAMQPAKWAYPCTPEEQLSFAVFQDLHERGFTITPGSKFGGQYLLYPGDPKLYHAQFVVRVIPSGQALDLVLLKSIARGVHAARKHLLLATAQPLDRESGEGATGSKGVGQNMDGGSTAEGNFSGVSVAQCAAFGLISYITIARETGFVSSKPPAAGPQPLPAVPRAVPPPPEEVQALA